jgi:hypothetical protein
MFDINLFVVRNEVSLHYSDYEDRITLYLQIQEQNKMWQWSELPSDAFDLCQR